MQSTSGTAYMTVEGFVFPTLADVDRVRENLVLLADVYPSRKAMLDDIGIEAFNAWVREGRRFPPDVDRVGACRWLDIIDAPVPLSYCTARFPW